MKKNILFTLVLLVVGNFIFCQNPEFFHFDQDTNYKKYFRIDSNDINNIWQVGHPQKSNFNSAYSNPNVLITDTINTYPPNNHSSVIIWQEIVMPVFAVSFKYFTNTDTLSDFGLVEFSNDMGSNWIPISEWTLESPVFSGNSNGWRSAYFTLGVDKFNMNIGDSILFRFTFTSDSVNTFKDGWMIDDIIIHQCLDIGVQENKSTNRFQVFYTGNNAIEIVQEELQNSGSLVFELFNDSGVEVLSKQLHNQKSNYFLFSKLPKGIYFYHIFDSFNMLKCGKVLIY